MKNRKNIEIKPLTVGRVFVLPQDMDDMKNRKFYEYGIKLFNKEDPTKFEGYIMSPNRYIIGAREFISNKGKRVGLIIGTDDFMFMGNVVYNTILDKDYHNRPIVLIDYVGGDVLNFGYHFANIVYI